MSAFDQPAPIPGGVMVYGLCPGCEAWQVEIPAELPLAAVEEAIREHADTECPALLRLHAERLGL